MGSVTAVASIAGAVVERCSYSAFGQSQVMTTSFANRSMSSYDWQTRFHGEQRDEETGFYNYGYRYYLPELGKWPSRDPIGENGGENLYGFVNNEGISKIDYLGLYEVGDLDDVRDYFAPDENHVADGAGMLDPSRNFVGIKNENLDKLKKAVEDAKKITDSYGHQCYYITLNLQPLNTEGFRALGTISDRAILVAHSDGDNVYTNGDNIPLGDLRGNCEAIGCHLNGQRRSPYLNVLGQVIDKIKALKAKDCCIPMEIIEIAVGTRAL
jgi:RHS repeat-associated protein